MIEFTLRKFPTSGDLKDECGLPFACIVQPFARAEHAPLDRPCQLKAKDVNRCTQCYGYINRYCLLERMGWVCCLCGNYNENTTSDLRYGRNNAQNLLPELREGVVEVECDPNEEADSESDAEDAAPPAQEADATPVYLALVDVGCEEETLELIRSALQAALEALPAAAQFGLITFSRRLGLYDVSSGGVPSVRYVPLSEGSEDDPPTSVDLEDALPLSSLLAPVAQSKDAIVTALEALAPEPFDAPPDADTPEELAGGRAFGSAVQAVLRYVSGAALLQQRRGSSTAATTSSTAPANGKAAAVAGAYAGARLLTFLTGPPNSGRGCVFHRQLASEQAGASADAASTIIMDPMMSDLNPYTYSMPAVPQQTAEAEQDAGPGEIVVDPDARDFYEEAAAAAASLAVCADVFVISRSRCGLSALEPLAAATGGALFLYASHEEAALPQDIYRRLGSPLARGGLLRLRTSPGFRVTKAYGHLFPDDAFENLFHIISADARDAFAFDLDYTSKGGLDSNAAAPTMQMVFQYSVLLPVAQSGAAASGGLDAAKQRFVLQRRMRIVTVPIPLATTPREVFDGCNPDAVLAVLLHKLIEAAAEDGTAEGHALLQDWLAILGAAYNRHILGLSGPHVSTQVDAALEAVEALQAVPRLVYGLLRSPLLVRRPGDHSDAATAARLLWGSLPIGELRRAVYPLLSSYSSPDAQAYPRHSLSEAALATAGAPIYFLDSYTTLMVYYAPPAAPTAEGAPPPQPQPFPPPQGSLLRNAINAARSGRRMTPQLRMFQAGQDMAERQFHASLIEEPDAELAAAGAEAGRGFVMFLESVKSEVVSILQEDA